MNCGPTWKEKEAAWRKWHRWFAWHPVRLGKYPEGSRDCRWLEVVDRRWLGGWENPAYEYRAINR